jgi:hypothetical protein
MKEGKGKFSGRFWCVHCGQEVIYDAQKNDLVCTNPKCTEGKSVDYGNMLSGYVWAGIIPLNAAFTAKDKVWSSISKDYVLEHKEKFNITVAEVVE